MSACASCPVAAQCHNPKKPDAPCFDGVGFWSLDSRQRHEALHGREYPPVQKDALLLAMENDGIIAITEVEPLRLSYDREQIDAARRLLESKGYCVLEKAA